jgi:delta14-sterol reductase/lamin-B receptor
VPFTYSLQARLLVDHDPKLSTLALCAIVLLNMAGYAIFRGANSQKDAFRRDPTAPALAHLKFMETKRGTRLLTSGWWGMARKINYTGDWMMGLAWCLCCGAITPIAYFYSIYFTVLLVHRASRDDHFCKVKYGEDWKAYKKKVPALFFPGII